MMLTNVSRSAVRVMNSRSRFVWARHAAVPAASAAGFQRMTLFTNAKKDHIAQAAPEKPAKNFFDKEVKTEQDIPTGQAVDQQLPSHRQLVEELPSAAEIEKAIREGKVDAYKTQDGHKDD